MWFLPVTIISPLLPVVPVAANLILPVYLHHEWTVFVAPRLLSLAQQNPAVLCSAAVLTWTRFTKDPDPAAAHPSSHSPGQSSLLVCCVEEEQRWKLEAAMGYLRLLCGCWKLLPNVLCHVTQQAAVQPGILLPFMLSSQREGNTGNLHYF